jgi:hypothetical protein
MLLENIGNKGKLLLKEAGGRRQEIIITQWSAFPLTLDDMQGPRTLLWELFSPLLFWNSMSKHRGHLYKRITWVSTVKQKNLPGMGMAPLSKCRKS